MLRTVRYVNGNDSAGCCRELPHGREKLTWVSCAVLQLSSCRVRVPGCAALSGHGGAYGKEEGIEAPRQLLKAFVTD